MEERAVLQYRKRRKRGHKSMSFCTLCGFRPLHITPLACMAGTTGLEPATSAVTAKRKVVTYRKQASRMASFGAVGNEREPLSNPYQTHDLCPVDVCPSRAVWASTTGIAG